MAADASAPKDEPAEGGAPEPYQAATEPGAQAPEALGPVVPAGLVAPEAPAATGESITGIQTVNAEDIPEEAR